LLHQLQYRGTPSFRIGLPKLNEIELKKSENIGEVGSNEGNRDDCVGTSFDLLLHVRTSCFSPCESTVGAQLSKLLENAVELLHQPCLPTSIAGFILSTLSAMSATPVVSRDVLNPQRIEPSNEKGWRTGLANVDYEIRDPRRI
jgi:hypothetical protein